MIFGVGIDFREPYDLFAVNDFTVDDRADFTVAAAGVETDSATVEMTADFKRAFLLRGESVFVGFYNLEFTLVNPFHKALVESAKSVICIGIFYIFVYPVVAADIDFISADHPENGLDESFRHTIVAVCVFLVGKHVVRVNVFISVVSFDADFQRLMSRLCDVRLICGELEIHRFELLVQRRYEFHMLISLRLNYNSL